MKPDSSPQASGHQNSNQIDAQYPSFLDEYTTLEAQVPLTAADARRLGGIQFEQQMRQQVAAGAYAAEWLRQIEALRVKLDDALEQSALPYLERRRWMVLQNQIEQINPAMVLGFDAVRSTPSTTPDNISDQLAEGATICELF